MTKSLHLAVLVAAVVSVAGLMAARADAASTYVNNFQISVERTNFTRHFNGSFSFERDRLSGVGKEVLTRSSGLNDVSFNFFGRKYTTADLQSARVVFVDGELVGPVFRFRHTNGKVYRVAYNYIELFKPRYWLGTVDFEAMTLVSSSQARALADVELPDVAHAPTPAAAMAGLALLSTLGFTRRLRSDR